MSLFRIPTLISSLAALTFVAGLSAPHAALAAQGQGELAQTPLTFGAQVAPSFIMAVDDSGSMTFQTLLDPQDGQAFWLDNGGFFNGTAYRESGSTIRPPYITDTNYNGTWNHVIPIGSGARIGNTRLAIPPIDAFGFARGPETNPFYYNPATNYLTWIDQDGAPYPNASTTALRWDPRVSTHLMNLTALHRDRTDDSDTVAVAAAVYSFPTGTYLEPGWQIRKSSGSASACTYNNGAGSQSFTVPGPSSAYLTVPASGYLLNAACNSVSLQYSRSQVPVRGNTENEQFTVPNTAVLPAGTKIYYDASNNACGVIGVNAYDRGNWRTLPVATTMTADCEMGIEYRVASFYLKTSTPAPTGFVTANRVLASNACGTGCNMYRYDIVPANYSTAAQYNQQLQNFANWFSYYGNRNRAMVAGMTRSLTDVTNMYVGYFTINSYSGSSPSTTNYPDVVMRNMAASAEKTLLFNDLLALDSGGSTPNRWAVYNLGRNFKRTGAGAPIRLACQKNAGMLFTDGYSNQNGPNATPQNADSGMGSPFADAHSNTLADLAAEYYNTNLRPDLTAGAVPVQDDCPSTDLTIDCNTNLHMNFYGVTLGAKGDVYGVTHFSDQDAFDNPPAWQARQNDDRSAVDEIWHGALNSRGQFINAQAPADITTAMRNILSDIGESSGPSGTIAVAGTRIGDATRVIEPAYAIAAQGTDWTGMLASQSVEVDSDGIIVFTTDWEASAVLPAAGARNIFYASPATTAVPTVRLFNSANLTNAETLCAGELSLCTAADITSAPPVGLGVTVTEAVNYLRGDPALEGTKLRDRSSPLGDIVNSVPVISSPTADFGYRFLRGATITDNDPYNYAGYLTAKAGRMEMVYVGANDGMLHAFNAANGIERFAFIPSTSVGHMGNLLFPYDESLGNDQRFVHRYYVDGPINVSDARIGGSWKTILVGTGGAGGKGIFALDVSNAGTMTTGNVLWELSPSVTTIGPTIGNMLSKPVIVPTRIGTADPVWKIVTGNGFDSANGTAALLVIDAGTGAVTSIPAAEASPPAMPNGLSSVVVIDRWIANTTTSGRDGYADTAYAGDQHGNIWKFDLRNNTLANGGLPVFTASVSGVRQPITGGLEAAAGPGGGMMIYFGTGSFAFDEDPNDLSLQTVYAVLDKAPATPVTLTRANLVPQVLNTGANSSIRSITSSSVNYVTQSGWYMDLAVTTGVTQTLTGERFVAIPRLQSGLILFPVFEPGSVATDPCDTGGTNWLYGMNAISGAAGLGGLSAGAPDGTPSPANTVGQLLDTSGEMPIRDFAVLILPGNDFVAAGGTLPPDGGGRNCKLAMQIAGAPTLYQDRPCGRQSWRQIR